MAKTPNRYTTRHRHVWASVDKLRGVDVLRCVCGHTETRRVTARQLPLWGD